MCFSFPGGDAEKLGRMVALAGPHATQKLAILLVSAHLYLLYVKPLKVFLNQFNSQTIGCEKSCQNFQM
jgi:hypothetical protein